VLRILFTIPIPSIPGLLPGGATIPVFSYGTFIALGFFVSYLYTCWLAKKRGIDEETITDIFLVIIISSIVGSRLNFVASQWSHYVAHPAAIFKVWEGGMVYLGGFIGAIAGGLVYLRIRGLAAGPFLDMFAPTVPFAQALGRLGCLCNGCCYGVPTDLPWGMSFPIQGEWSRPRHPTQLYEVVILLALSIFLHFYYRRNRIPGLVMVGYGYLYGLERFAIEFFRAESMEEHYLFGTTLAQTTCMALVLVTLTYHLAIVRHPATGGGLAREAPGQARRRSGASTDEKKHQ